DPFMDQIVRELDDLRRNCPRREEVPPISLVEGATLSSHERHAFALAYELMRVEQEAVANLRDHGLYLGADLVRLAAARVRGGERPPWSGVAVAAVHRLDTVSRDLLLVLAEVVDVVFLPGPASPHVRSIVAGWGLPRCETKDAGAANALARRFLLGDRSAL